MGFWINFWKVLLFTGLSLFAGLTVLVSIGGFFNILSLFKSLGNRSEQEDESSCKKDD